MTLSPVQGISMKITRCTTKPRVSPEKALAFTKMSVVLAAVWPSDIKTKGLRMKLVDLVWCCSVLSSMCLLLPLLASIYVYKDNPIVVSKSVCLSCAVTQVIMKTVVCRVNRKKIQLLLKELDDFLKTAKLRERRMCQKYVSKRAPFHMVITLCCYGASLFVICGPIFLPYSLPTDAVYPFSVQTGPAWSLTYVHQAIAGFQASAGMCVDGFVAFLLWFTGIRFELLCRKFEKIQNMQEMYQCIREHQKVLRYGKELVGAFRYVLFATVFSVTAGLAFAGIYLFSPQPMFVKGQFAIVSISAGINLYVTALPADNLIVMCRKLSDVAYTSLWIRNSSGAITKNWITIIHRAQKPVTVNIPGLIKELSLKYYFNVLSSTFSYFTALHVIMMKNVK
ncbi:uncharacterized protein LOC106637410 [Copidosoma floridanum]|nr:uncharacterized protein LOC106637410 [Copidosoma floridanum]